ncbi:hypothetical protein B0H13DRAFT_1883884 [Mycena leptocephala]|nr:hypothetical protein B0H13DRAFT_1883884 [Mycena leptocephala]
MWQMCRTADTGVKGAGAETCLYSTDVDQATAGKIPRPGSALDTGGHRSAGRCAAEDLEGLEVWRLGEEAQQVVGILHLLARRVSSFASFIKAVQLPTVSSTKTARTAGFVLKRRGLETAMTVTEARLTVVLGRVFLVEREGSAYTFGHKVEVQFFCSLIQPPHSTELPRWPNAPHQLSMIAPDFPKTRMTLRLAAGSVFLATSLSKARTLAAELLEHMGFVEEAGALSVVAEQDSHVLSPSFLCSSILFMQPFEAALGGRGCRDPIDGNEDLEKRHSARNG